MVRKAKVEVKEHVRGGEGSVEFHHVVSKEELCGHGRLFACLRIKPHSSIGIHEHIGETEPYYIISGNGIYIDQDGSRIPVGPGDVCLLDFGKSHGIENPNDEDLVMMALVYFESDK